MFKSAVIATALSLAAIGSALAQMPPMQVITDPAKVESGAYAVEPNHTVVGFGVNHMGFSTYYGLFSGVSGTLDLDAKKPGESKLEIHVPVASVVTPSEKLNGELKGDKWLDADKFPEMVFKSTKVTVKAAGEGKVTGDLTLHGVTKTVTFLVKFHGAGPNPMSKKFTVGFDVMGKIKRSDFGVSTYVPLISDEVDIDIGAAFEKQG